MEIIPTETIERKIFLIRGHKVMLDADLARLYGIETRILVQAVKRNLAKFPEDFMFQITPNEFLTLRSQFVISKSGKGGRRYLPYAFTEHGVAMLSSVLKSPRAVQMNISIIRAFIKLQEILLTHKELAQKMESLERKQKDQGDQVTEIYSFIKNLLKHLLNPQNASVLIYRLK
ncbi:MAG: ORF6N domain-containing protein [Patescibacteria group bacterium]|nr:ORF6N domain-containing protein [Patescibacteria group bacterium]